MIDKTLATCAEAVAQVFDGATLMLGGFGNPGIPAMLIEALRQQGAKDLVIISNNAGTDDWGLGGLFKDGRVRKLYASFPNSKGTIYFAERYLKGEVELELVPQGTLIERIRAGGAGIGGFYTPTGVGTELAKGKETRFIDGREQVLETALHADFTFIRAHKADRVGNLTYRLAMRNFNPVMATAAKFVAVEVDEIVPVGSLPIEEIHTPGIFVDAVVQVERHPKLFEPQPRRAKK